ncbi:hypothetical protein K491DRAFT_172621 [Lophiostoma macrostomum CBS 122681]|uniref:Uncharacterized protein n=1 Tax=Lophiostoma macrostomum CBS 122681 TaxID=1314788 RepID=A0A6A6SRP6_9PLEO|nr:hypothetical protein K491DRAFT_172621 [Lophiostoma macrostomum CBS 122681]
MVLEHHTNHRTAQTDDWNTIIKDDDDFCDLKALAQGFVEVMSKGPEPAKAAPEYRENPGLLNFHQPPPGWDPKNITPVGYQDVREAHHGLGQGTPDIPFTELLRGVTKIPTGDDAADLTRAIAWAAAAELRSGKVYMFPKDLPEVIAQAGVAKRNAFRADGEVVARFKRHYVEVYKLNPDRPTTRRELWPGFADKEKRSCYDAAPHEHKWKVEHAEIVQKAADLLPVEARHIFYTIHKPDPWLHPDTEHLNTGKPHPYSDFISDTPIDAHVDDADFIAVVMSTRAKATKEGTPTGGPPAPTNHRWSYGDYNPLLIERLRQRSGATQKKEPEQAETAPDDGKGSDTEEDDSMAIEHEQKMQKEREEKQKKKREEQRMMPPPKLPARARARRVAQTTGGKQVQKRIYRVAKQPSAAKQIPKSSATRKARPAWDIPPLFLADPKRYREITKDFPSERAETDLGWPKGLGDWTVPASTSWTKVKQLAWELEKEATGGQPTWTDQLWLSPF